MRRLKRQFLSVLSLVCRLPVPSPSEFDYGRTDFFLPLVGILAGAVAWLGFALGSLVLPGSAVAATLGALGLQYFAFNLFHLDGLLDSADALFPVADKERRLQILKDSRIGTYAFGTGIFVLAVKAFALGGAIGRAAGEPVLRLALFAYPVAGRAAGALVPLLARPAREDGLGSLMRGFSPLAWAFGSLLALVPFAASAYISRGTVGLAIFLVVSLVSAAASGFGLAAVYKAKVGGFTGDTLGAAVEIGETLFLVAAVAFFARL
jgi:adenosylcobinamide-GDP ribazoletransferase